MEVLLRFLALVALYAGMQCLALAMGGGLTRFADYESPKPEWRRAILAGLISAVGVIILDAYVQTNLNTFKEIRRAERTLFYGSMLILLVCHRFVYRSGDEADMLASGGMLNECALRNASRQGLVLVNSRGALVWWMTRGRGVVRGVLL